MWILFIVIIGPTPKPYTRQDTSGTVLQTREFVSKKSCVRAMGVVKEMMPSRHEYKARCVKK
jgi:hypothetical protein